MRKKISLKEIDDLVQLDDIKGKNLLLLKSKIFLAFFVKCNKILIIFYNLFFVFMWQFIEGIFVIILAIIGWIFIISGVIYFFQWIFLFFWFKKTGK